MKIKPLPPEVKSVLRTGITMTDLTQCAVELVSNNGINSLIYVNIIMK